LSASGLSQMTALPGRVTTWRIFPRLRGTIAPGCAKLEPSIISMNIASSSFEAIRKVRFSSLTGARLRSSPDSALSPNSPPQPSPVRPQCSPAQTTAKLWSMSSKLIPGCLPVGKIFQESAGLSELFPAWFRRGQGVGRSREARWRGLPEPGLSDLVNESDIQRGPTASAHPLDSRWCLLRSRNSRTWCPSCTPSASGRAVASLNPRPGFPC